MTGYGIPQRPGLLGNFFTIFSGPLSLAAGQLFGKIK